MATAMIDKDLKKVDDGDVGGPPKFSVLRAAELHRRGRDVPSAWDIADADLKEYAETIRLLGE